jgi:hypothetical protein
MADQSAQKPPIAQAYDAVEKVLDNMAKLESTMGPYVERAKAILKAGLEAANQKKASPAAAGGAPPPPGAPPAGQMPA